MHHIPVGRTHEEHLLVTSEVAIHFIGMEEARVLSTPHMIMGMEMTCRNGVYPLLEPGHDTLGTHVDVYHLAGAPIGASVVFRAVVTSVTGRRVTFRVEAFSGEEKIGEGTHERAVVNVARFAARLAAKKLS
jgi:predicted thioesterase